MPSIRNLSIHRPIADYAAVRSVWGNAIRGRHFQFHNKSLAEKSYLNVGCGSNINERFINLDYLWQPGIDLCWNVVKGIPLVEDSINGIYTEHCLEHLSYLDTTEVLKDFLRILKPMGTLRVVVPDAELYLNLYNRGKTDCTVHFPYDQPAYITSKSEQTPMMVVNSVFRGHGHQYAYDYYTLYKMLENLGFTNIQKEKYRVGRNQTLLIDSEYRACESLYVEANAP